MAIAAQPLHPPKHDDDSVNQTHNVLLPFVIDDWVALSRKLCARLYKWCFIHKQMQRFKFGIMPRFYFYGNHFAVLLQHKIFFCLRSFFSESGSNNSHF
jgi:hypothetical protein